VDLLGELVDDRGVDDVGVCLARHGHWRAFEGRDAGGEVRDETGGELALLCDVGGELARVVLDILA
jgi:hypothetical protein